MKVCEMRGTTIPHFFFRFTTGFRDPNPDDGHEQYNRLRWLRGFVGSHTIVNSIWDAFAYIKQLEDLQIANNGERSFERRRIADLEAQMLSCSGPRHGELLRPGLLPRHQGELLLRNARPL